jgi:hypothetical protein
MACGLMRLPLLTFGVLSIFSGYFLAFRCVFGAGVEDGLDGEEEFGEVAGGPAGKPANKRFNH